MGSAIKGTHVRRRGTIRRMLAGRVWCDNPRVVESAEADAIVLAAQGGDEEALNALLKRYQPQILRFGLKMCRNPDDAGEVLQDTLFAAARTLHGFRGASSVSTWLYSIARSFCIKRRRRRVFAPHVVSLESASQAAATARDHGRDPERALADRELGAELQAAIAALEPAYREVLLLRDVEGLSAAEVAEVTALSVAAVKSRLHRARAEVRGRLAPLLRPAGPAWPPGAATCPDVVASLSRHLEGEIDQDACAEMERHVADCPRCDAACQSLRQTLRLCGATPAPDVPETLQQSIRLGIRNVLAGRA
jgi:RNA polymerase sigma-70 factor (ECF subfamily)